LTPVAHPSQQFSRIFEKYWPTAAALGVALMLLPLMIRKPNLDDRPETNGAEILSLAGHRNSRSDAADKAKERINRMFRDDPDKAAAAIEGWIKKAS
jgi:flagellar biosynthesis/type III secretory pathway M-ring protein FliF/YscJ